MPNQQGTHRQIKPIKHVKPLTPDQAMLASLRKKVDKSEQDVRDERSRQKSKRENASSCHDKQEFT